MQQNKQVLNALREGGGAPQSFLPWLSIIPLIQDWATMAALMTYGPQLPKFLTHAGSGILRVEVHRW